MALSTQGLPGQNHVYNALEFGGWIYNNYISMIKSGTFVYALMHQGPAKGRSKFSLGIGSKIKDVLTGLAWNGYWFYAQVKQV